MRWVFDDGGRVDAGYLGSARDCVVRAVAIADGRPYKVVYDELFDRARQAQYRVKVGKNRSPRNGVFRSVYEPYLMDRGWIWHPVSHIGSGCKMHLRDGEFPSAGRYIARLSRHLVAVIDGVIHDTANPDRGGSRCVYGYWSGRADHLRGQAGAPGSRW